MISLTQLESGFRIVSDLFHEVETVTVSLAVKIGSRYESKNQSGISHFLEHMAFKGTATRTALEIAHSIENVGGIMNAYTSKENTVYYIKVLKNDLKLAIDILSDIIQNSNFAQEEVEKERGVILQELASGEDTPDDIAFDYYYSTLFKNQSLGRPIIGNKKTISSFKKEDFEEYIQTKYNASNMVLAVAGNANHEEVCNLASKFFNKLGGSKNIVHEKGNYTGGEFIRKNKKLSQVQYLLGHKAFDMYDDKVYALRIGNNILGGGMSSRLFQEVREKRGLVYTISSFDGVYTDVGTFGIYAGTDPKHKDELSKVIQEELHKITQSITDEEYEKTINQLKAGLLMSLESTSARSQKLASNILFRNRVVSHEETIKNFEAVTKTDILNVFKEILQTPQTFVLYGNV